MHVVRLFLIAGLIATCLFTVPSFGSGVSSGDRSVTESKEEDGSRTSEKQQSGGYPLSYSEQSAGSDFQNQFELPKDPDSLLHEILARSEFQQASKETLWDRMMKRAEELLLAFFRWLAELLGSVGNGSGFNPHSLWRVAEGLLIGSAILLALYVAKALFEYFRDRKGRSAEPPAERTEILVYLSSSRLREEAMQCARRGDYRTGLILLFRSVLVRLEEEGKIARHRGKTNREVLRSISGDGIVRETVGRLVPVFDGVCYGKARCGKEEYDRFLRLCTRVIQGV